ncbi:hypothetical protein ACEXQE_13645 [Herbiconiux sp. P17]|uniref:hypothetical protein n=1 Tax=Herbiconiux wuyangfengii TaxID=3342794 RepID=UPI0035B71FC3
MAALIVFTVPACASSERQLPPEIVDRVSSGDVDVRAAEECAHMAPDSPTSHLDAAWGGTLSEAVELAEDFDSRNTDPRLALSSVDASSYVAFCAFSGSQWESMIPAADHVITYSSSEVPLTQDPKLSTTVNGIVGYV